jgi:hypothetical protein
VLQSGLPVTEAGMHERKRERRHVTLARHRFQRFQHFTGLARPVERSSGKTYAAREEGA